MKKEIAGSLVAIGLAIASVGIASCQRPDAPDVKGVEHKGFMPALKGELKDYKPFRSQKFPYEIIYPHGWETDTTGDSDLFRNNKDQEVLISARPLLSGEGPGEFAQKQHRRIREDSEYIISAATREVAGRSGILFSSRMRNGNDSTVVIFSDSDNKLTWMISLNTPPSATASGQKNLDFILNSFKVTESSIKTPDVRAETPPKPPSQIEVPKPGGDIKLYISPNPEAPFRLMHPAKDWIPYYLGGLASTETIEVRSQEIPAARIYFSLEAKQLPKQYNSFEEYIIYTPTSLLAGFPIQTGRVEIRNYKAVTLFGEAILEVRGVPLPFYRIEWYLSKTKKEESGRLRLVLLLKTQKQGQDTKNLLIRPFKPLNLDKLMSLTSLKK